MPEYLYKTLIHPRIGTTFTSSFDILVAFLLQYIAIR